MRTFFVALATGGAVALALPAVNALTMAVADDWIATDRPVQLTQAPDTGHKAEKARKTRPAIDKEQPGSAAGVATQPLLIQTQALPASTARPDARR